MSDKIVNGFYLSAMRRYSWFAIIFVLFSVMARGQSDYYSTDSITYVGVNVLGGTGYSNARICEVQEKDNKVVRYSPSQITGYGFSDGRTFISKAILLNGTLQQVFLQRLVNGKVTLYYYRGRATKTFYIEKNNSTLTAIPKRNREYPDSNFHTFLLGMTTNCPIVANGAKLARYNKRSMQKFFTAYNTCESITFPFFKYGVYFECGFTKLTQDIVIDLGSFQAKKFTTDHDLSFAIFCDMPIMQSNFSLHPEFYYQKNGFSGNFENNSLLLNCVINIKSVNIPVLLRYTHPGPHYDLFGDAGLLYSHNFSTNSVLYQTEFNGNIINITEIKGVPLISSEQYGYVAGIGLRYKTGLKRSLFAELRYNNVYGSRETLGNFKVQLLTGISF